MIKVTLKGNLIGETIGETIIIEGGKGASYEEETKAVTTYRVVETSLQVRDMENIYQGKVLASFKADEVLYYEYIEDKEQK